MYWGGNFQFGTLSKEKLKFISFFQNGKMKLELGKSLGELQQSGRLLKSLAMTDFYCWSNVSVCRLYFLREMSLTFCP
jgi:hypothetical protein